MPTQDEQLDAILDFFWSELYNDMKPVEPPLTRDYEAYRMRAKLALQRMLVEAQIRENQDWIDMRVMLSAELDSHNPTSEPSFVEQANNQVIEDHKQRIADLQQQLQPKQDKE
jgi:hypothetical protein